MRRLSVVAFAVSLVVVLVSVSAQTNFGHIRGVVNDSAGLAIPGVTVTLSHDNDAPRTAITDSKGAFAFLGIAPGHYTLTAAVPGFTTKTAVADVRANDVTKVSIALSVGSLAETVTVTGASPGRKNRQSREVGVEGGVVGGVTGGIVGGLAAAAPAAAAAPMRSPSPGGFNTETYDRVKDNEWTEVARHPLSTFSTDVDTASYSNVRRFLNDGQRPPRDAVRVEELINYFPFHYPDPRDGKPIAVTTAIGDCPWNAGHRLALIGVQARRIDASRLPPRNLVFLIDVSGSMFGPHRLPLVKASLAMLAPNLTDKDRVAIVVYAGNSGLVLPSTSGGDTPTILDALHRLEAGGSTNGGQGLMLAYTVAQEHFIKGGVNRVILATDGDFNVGVTDQGSLVRFVEEKRSTGIALTVLGFGMGNVKDSTMEKLADAGNGNYAYIDSLNEAQKVLVEQAGGTLVTVAKDVKLQIEFNPRLIASYRLIGYENRLLKDEDFNNDAKDAGDMGAGHSVTALYELIPAGQPAETTAIDPLKYQQAAALSGAARTDEAMTVKVRYKEPDADKSALISVAVPRTEGSTLEMGFAAAVAEFGMLLRDSEFKGSATFEQARELAQRFQGTDTHGHRAEFIRLIGAAEGVTRLASRR